MEDRQYIQYYEGVTEAGIGNLNELSYANEKDLIDMGISNKFHRRRILGDMKTFFSP